jgi:autotransporter-associated beta strand protein
VSSTITGLPVTYAKGGNSGGGSGGQVSATPAPAATNTGNGGNGISPNRTSSSPTPINGQTGGSGIVVVRYTGDNLLTGGTVSTDGGDTVHQFLNAGASTLGFNASIAGDIDGDGNLIWDGGGTLTLSGSNGYTGTTAVINGTLKMGANNVFSDSTDILIGTATLDADTFDDTVDTLDVTGTAVINLGTGANLVFAGGGTATWDGTLNITGAFVSGSSLNFGSSSGLTSTQLAAITINGVTGFYTLDGSGFLTSGGGSPFDTWATRGGATGVTFDGDANEDGVPDGLAFLLGAENPDDNATGRLPTVSENGSGGLVLTFNCLPIADRGNAKLHVEHSGDLGVSDAWLATVDQVPDTTDTAPDNGVTFVVTPGSPTNRVVATISSSEPTGGKLFGRLHATEN